jgi:hypothetical protein
LGFLNIGDEDMKKSFGRYVVSLARMIHERFYCNRRYAAATSLAAVSLRPGGQARFS